MKTQTMIVHTEKNRVEVDTNILKENFKVIKDKLHPGVQLMGVIKSDAYGQGLCEVGRVLYGVGMRSFGVGNLDEANKLRHAMPDATIYILGPSFLDGADEIIKGGFIPLVSSYTLLECLNGVARSIGMQARVHLLIDTGMGRIGLWHELGEEFIKKLRDFRNIRIEGVASHFSSVDCDLAFSYQQIEYFNGFLLKLQSYYQDNYQVHMANSGALLSLSHCQYDMVRIGLLLYGAYSSTDLPRIDVRPVVSWKTQLAFIKVVESGRPISYGRTFISEKRTKIGTIPVGYCHGYPRALSNIGDVIVRGRRVPIVGRITMDQMMVDLGPTCSDKIGDEVVLIGKQDGQQIDIEELASKSNTVPYEILCNMKGKRIYIS